MELQREREVDLSRIFRRRRQDSELRREREVDLSRIFRRRRTDDRTIDPASIEIRLLSE